MLEIGYRFTIGGIEVEVVDGDGECEKCPFNNSICTDEFVDMCIELIGEKELKTYNEKI